MIRRREKTETALDVACGTGDLVNEIGKLGIHAVGVDFAEEMIGIARDKALRNNCNLAEFVCCSIFDYDFGQSKFDLISANGFIEYISFAQLEDFLELAFVGLRSGGSLVVGSRNRLFNAFSMNDFTVNEIKGRTINSLLLECVAWVNGLSLEKLGNLEPVPFPVSGRGDPNTGIQVSVRYQYTPVQLMKLVREKGFEPVHICPIHIHGTVPRFKDQYPAVHQGISSLLRTYAEENTSLTPNASSFMLHAKKT